MAGAGPPSTPLFLRRKGVDVEFRWRNGRNAHSPHSHGRSCPHSHQDEGRQENGFCLTVMAGPSLSHRHGPTSQGHLSRQCAGIGGPDNKPGHDEWENAVLRTPPYPDSYGDTPGHDGESGAVRQIVPRTSTGNCAYSRVSTASRIAAWTVSTSAEASISTQRSGSPAAISR